MKQKKAKKERKTIRKLDLTELEKTFKEMNNDRGQLGLSILEEVIFQKETLEKMKQEIKENSLTAEYNKQKRSNPIIAGYNAMINNYSKLTRQLVDLLPPQKNEADDFDLDDFLNEEY